MASNIQISRGSLRAKGPENLLRAELFWVPKNNSNESENQYRTDTRFPYDTGTLYIGMPSLGNTYENPMPIAGERSYKGMVFRGFVDEEQDITNIKFAFVREGDYFIFNKDAENGVFKDEEFLKNDILLITHAEYDVAPDLLDNVGQARNVQYIKLYGSGNLSKNTKYTHPERPGITNVKIALDDIYDHKLEYRGCIGNGGDFSYAALMTYQNSARDHLTAGSLYLVIEDNLSFTGNNNSGVLTTWTSHKGDFVIWQNDTDQWALIPSGYTDAEQIDFNPTLAVQQQTDFGTFGEDGGEHMSSTASLTNVQEAITYLLSHKAMLDSNGKIPLSQLHSTVIGGMQYMGTWNPVTDEQGVNDPAHQNPWPTGRTNDEIAGDEEGSGEGASAVRGNKPGDYYIVKSTPVITNIQYYDKDSQPVGDLFTRCEEINNGDWIVYQVDPVTNKASWEIIDNSDSLTALNFFINGTHTSGKADYATNTTEVSLVGNPTFAASDKLVLWQQDNKVTVAGVRLVDYDGADPNIEHLDKYLPVYTGNNNTVKRSTIQNYLSPLFGDTYVTQTNSNLFVGNASDTYNEYVYGDIYLRPKLVVKDGVDVNENTGLKFDVITEQGSTVYNSSTLRPDDAQANGANFYLPTKSSKLVGKLTGVTLLKNRLTKVSANDSNGYIDNSSIEEHMHQTVSSPNYVDIDVASVEFHAPVIDVNNIETRHITLGQKSNLNPNASNGGHLSNNGRLLEAELLSEIFAHPNQTTSNVTNYLPAESGILVNNTDLNRMFNGTKNILPIYGEPQVFPGENSPRISLIDSKIEQVSNSLFESLLNSVHNVDEDTRTLGGSQNVSSDKFYNLKDRDFIKELYDDFELDSGNNKVFKNTGTPDNIEFKSDTIVGETAIGANGRFINKPKSLMVTKSLILGNKDTNLTHVVPGRTMFPRSTQYMNPRDNSSLPEKAVYVEMPGASGVLLTDNSVIDCGLYV